MLVCYLFIFKSFDICGVIIAFLAKCLFLRFLVLLSKNSNRFATTQSVFWKMHVFTTFFLVWNISKELLLKHFSYAWFLLIWREIRSWPFKIYHQQQVTLLVFKIVRGCFYANKKKLSFQNNFVHQGSNNYFAFFSKILIFVRCSFFRENDVFEFYPNQSI